MWYGGAVGLAMLTGLSACTNPYDPAQRSARPPAADMAPRSGRRSAAGSGPLPVPQPPRRHRRLSPIIHRRAMVAITAVTRRRPAIT